MCVTALKKKPKKTSKQLAIPAYVCYLCMSQSRNVRILLYRVRRMDERKSVVLNCTHRWSEQVLSDGGSAAQTQKCQLTEVCLLPICLRMLRASPMIILGDEKVKSVTFNKGQLLFKGTIYQPLSVNTQTLRKASTV